MGPAGLTAVFGMGTGVAPPVWSPGSRPAGGQPRRPRFAIGVRVRTSTSQASRVGPVGVRGHRVRAIGPASSEDRRGLRVRDRATPPVGRVAAGGGGSGWSSRSAVRTGRLRRSPAVHARPIDLVVFQEPS